MQGRTEMQNSLCAAHRKKGGASDIECCLVCQAIQKQRDSQSLR
ncbi:hypothetical protein SAMN05443245_6301 [Paraburkholderia fungorum]|uniref:Uncharacterized protein n=1 Tax=Paraburkholderia fungorum TaxID=134537 RepID=A0A1H1JFX8_9BURK|nr:hypothetical protein SAMN05443245_6301 [Paraburkholderia fungorum]